MNQQTIQEYINNFRTYISRSLRPNIGLEIEVYDCGEQGAVLIVKFNPGGRSGDNFSKNNSIADALSGIEQNFIAGDLSGVTFRGTNISMMEDKIIFIKDSNPYEWTLEKMQEDISMITSPPRSA